MIFLSLLEILSKEIFKPEKEYTVEQFIKKLEKRNYEEIQINEVRDVYVELNIQVKENEGIYKYVIYDLEKKRVKEIEIETPQNSLISVLKSILEIFQTKEQEDSENVSFVMDHESCEELTSKEESKTEEDHSGSFNLELFKNEIHRLGNKGVLYPGTRLIYKKLGAVLSKLKKVESPEDLITQTTGITQTINYISTIKVPNKNKEYLWCAFIRKAKDSDEQSADDTEDNIEDKKPKEFYHYKTPIIKIVKDLKNDIFVSEIYKSLDTASGQNVIENSKAVDAAFHKWIVLSAMFFCVCFLMILLAALRSKINAIQKRQLKLKEQEIAQKTQTLETNNTDNQINTK